LLRYHTGQRDDQIDTDTIVTENGMEGDVADHIVMAFSDQRYVDMPDLRSYFHDVADEISFIDVSSPSVRMEK